MSDMAVKQKEVFFSNPEKRLEIYNVKDELFF